MVNQKATSEILGPDINLGLLKGGGLFFVPRSRLTVDSRLKYKFLAVPRLQKRIIIKLSYGQGIEEKK
jgi:hypothetical protein